MPKEVFETASDVSIRKACCGPDDRCAQDRMYSVFEETSTFGSTIEQLESAGY